MPRIDSKLLFFSAALFLWGARLACTEQGVTLIDHHGIEIGSNVFAVSS